LSNKKNYPGYFWADLLKVLTKTGLFENLNFKNPNQKNEKLRIV